MRRLEIFSWGGNPNPTCELGQLGVACLQRDNTSPIFGRVDVNDRGDTTRTSTRGDRGSPTRTNYHVQNIVPRWWRLKKYCGSHNRNAQPARSAKPHENRPNGPKTRAFAQHVGSLIAVAAPRAAFRGSVRLPKRDRGSDGFLAWAAKRKERSAEARTRRRKLSLLSTLVGVRQ